MDRLMTSTFQSWLQHFKPQLPSVRWSEIARSSVGAGLGICLTSLICFYLTDQASPGHLWLIAPMGASALLIFAAPASPMAQPWPVLAGNTLSALSAWAVLFVLPPTPLSAGVAVGVAMLSMFLTRSLHPPGAATALLMVLSHTTALDFVLFPVAINALTLILLGMMFNNLTGKSYPHLPQHRALSHETLKRDLEQVLATHNEVLDISLEDLEVIFEEVSALHSSTS
jgi:CBS domain-containing membrane protein